MVSLSKAISVIDSSVAGIGGCPYAKVASGNVATEDVLYMCELLGIEHGVNWEKIIKVGIFISEAINTENQASVTIQDLDKIEELKSYIYGD